MWAVLLVALLLLGFSAGVFAFTVPIWLPIVLVVLSVVQLGLLVWAQRSPRRSFSATTGGGRTPPLTPQPEHRPVRGLTPGAPTS